MRAKRPSKIIITFSDSEHNELLFGYFKKGNFIVRLEYWLNIDDISNVPFSNARYYEKLFFTKAELVHERANNVLKEINSFNKDTPVELFVNRLMSNSLCNLYYFAKEFSGFSNVVLNYYHSETVKLKNGVTGPKIVIDESIVLTDEVISDLSARWQELSTNNAAVRCGKGGEIVELSRAEAIAAVFPFFSDEFQRFPNVEWNFYTAKKDEYVMEYGAFEYVVSLMIDEGIVERTEKVDTQSGCSDIFFEQDFRLKPRN